MPDSASPPFLISVNRGGWPQLVPVVVRHACCPCKHLPISADRPCSSSLAESHGNTKCWYFFLSEFLCSPGWPQSHRSICLLRLNQVLVLSPFFLSLFKFPISCQEILIPDIQSVLKLATGTGDWVLLIEVQYEMQHTCNCSRILKVFLKKNVYTH